MGRSRKRHSDKYTNVSQLLQWPTVMSCVSSDPSQQSWGVSILGHQAAQIVWLGQDEGNLTGSSLPGITNNSDGRNLQQETD